MPKRSRECSSTHVECFQVHARQRFDKIQLRIDGDNLRFSIEDTGHGIEADDINNIFDRFYQVDKIHPNGSGIEVVVGQGLCRASREVQ